VGLLLDRTNFYAEQGGQVGDTGTIDKPDTGGLEFRVDNTIRLGDTVLHLGVMLAGTLSVGEEVTLMQATFRRIDIMRNHTATHLLNLALRQELGGHIEQRGSLVDEEKTRFDFSHDKPLSAVELKRIEERVNRAVGRDLAVSAMTMPLDEAKKLPGVRAMFGEKYPDPVRVVFIGPDSPELATKDDSVEFCGGTHVPRTGNIGYFKFIGQEAVAKGIRRVTAVTGRASATAIQQLSSTVDEMTGKLQCLPDELPTRLEALQLELASLKQQNTKLLSESLSSTVDALIASAETVNGVSVVIGQLVGGNSELVRTQMDRIRQKLGSVYAVLAWVDADGKAAIVVALSPDLVKRGNKAGDLVKQIAAVVGGSGGGKPDLAQAGGKESSKLPDALTLAKTLASGLK
jgi:alanyl-tRNA synthetase